MNGRNKKKKLIRRALSRINKNYQKVVDREAEKKSVRIIERMWSRDFKTKFLLLFGKISVVKFIRPEKVVKHERIKYEKVSVPEFMGIDNPDYGVH